MDSNNFDALRNELDNSNMFDILKGFPLQVKEACDIGQKSPKFPSTFKSDNFTVLGMGGSAIGGSLIKSYFNSLPGATHLNISVNRNYSVPGYCSKDTNFIACSYSGNTEETLSALEDACKLTNNIVCITSGGKLRELAGERAIPYSIIPGGFQPRCALAYSVFPLIYTFINNGLLSNEAVQLTRQAIDELFPFLENRAAQYADYSSPGNEAVKIARELHGTIPVIYSADERLDSVNVRWRNQIQENAKNLAFGSYLPEMNHNEINGWTLSPNGLPEEIMSRFCVIILQDADDNPRVSLRYKFLEKVLNGKTKTFRIISGEGNHLLTRMIDLIYLGDWVSYYMALLNTIDPTPIPMINELKEMLASTNGKSKI